MSPTRSDTNRAVRSQNMARGLKFRILVEEGLYYPYSENKGGDQHRGYREADQRLCFRICKKPVFSQRGSSDTGAKLLEKLLMPFVNDIDLDTHVHPCSLFCVTDILKRDSILAMDPKYGISREE